MREVKFRAWYAPRTWMLKVTGLHWDYKTGEQLVEVDVIDPNDKNNGIEFDYKILKLMQFTGLKDITGTDIYEGDIIQRYEDGYFRGKELNWRGEVIKETTCFSVERNNDFNINKYCEYIEWPDEFFDNVKIIGNVYENPELLE